MKKRFLSFLFSLLLGAFVFGQSPEARKFDEFGVLSCGDFSARLDNFYHAFQDSADSKLYVIYYEDDGKEERVWNRKLKKYETQQIAPVRGTALNFAKAFPLYLEKLYKIPKGRMILADGGFRESRMFEMWIIPAGAELPKPTPTINAGSVKLKNGKPRKTPDYANCYSGYE